MSQLSNSEAELEALAADVIGALQSAKRAGVQSLTYYKAAGHSLNLIKELVPRGDFGREVQLRCGCTKQWYTRLMKLDRVWEDVLASQSWAEGCGRTLGRREFSVDGALALVGEWRGQKRGEQQKQKSATRSTLASVRNELDSARQELAAATARLADVGSELRSIKGQLAVADAYVEFLEQGLGITSPAGPRSKTPIDQRTKERMRKVAGLWFRAFNASPGERDSALERFQQAANRHGMALRDFVAECGVSSPGNWTKAA